MTNQVRSLTLTVMGMFLFWTGLATTAVAASPIQDQDNSVMRPEIENFEVFLDGHAALGRQLRSNPSLVNNEEFLENHPALQQYLENHPNLREELQENPRAFARRSERFEGPEARRAAGDRDLDITRVDPAGLDMFLDNHSDIAQQLSKNPSLADNPQYLKAHPELQQFLQTHPDLRAELAENPQSVLRTPPPLESRESQGDVSGFDLFLDGHPDIARQLSKDPSLADNPEYLKSQPALQQFLQTHPDLRAELSENPQSVLGTEQRLERRESQGDVAGFDAFLDHHPAISQQLSKDPRLIRSQAYLQEHPELQQFLQTHPDLRAEMTENPNALMKAERQWDNREAARSDDFGRGMAKGELSMFEAFLDAHPQVSAELSRNPSLARNEEYLESHPELRRMLNQNSAIQQQLTQNPEAFLNAATRTEDQHTVRPQPPQLTLLHPEQGLEKH
jgi:hypothetical protein